MYKVTKKTINIEDEVEVCPSNIELLGPNNDVPVDLVYTAIKEKNQFQQPIEYKALPGIVMAAQTGTTKNHLSRKTEEEQAFDQNWDPTLGYNNFKIAKDFYFGGMKKQLKIPISMPHRIIIEPNPPRQGYSHLTWNTLNEYFLQRSMTFQQYQDILIDLKKIAFKVYAINREENKSLSNTRFMKFSNFVWFFCILSVIVLFISETDQLFGAKSQIFVEIMFVISIVLIFSISMLNFIQYPPQNIFINYEKLLRQQIMKMFQKLNQQYATEKNGLKFGVAQNDILWIEISIPKVLQMPYSEYQIQRQIDQLNKKKKQDLDSDDEFEPIELYRVVDTQDEADQLNLEQMEKVKCPQGECSHSHETEYLSQDSFKSSITESDKDQDYYQQQGKNNSTNLKSSNYQSSQNKIIHDYLSNTDNDLDDVKLISTNRSNQRNKIQQKYQQPKPKSKFQIQEQNSQLKQQQEFLKNDNIQLNQNNNDL